MGGGARDPDQSNGEEFGVDRKRPGERIGAAGMIAGMMARLRSGRGCDRRRRNGRSNQALVDEEPRSQLHSDETEGLCPLIFLPTCCHENLRRSSDVLDPPKGERADTSTVFKILLHFKNEVPVRRAFSPPGIIGGERD